VGYFRLPYIVLYKTVLTLNHSCFFKIIILIKKKKKEYPGPSNISGQNKMYYSSGKLRMLHKIMTTSR